MARSLASLDRLIYSSQLLAIAETQEKQSITNPLLILKATHTKLGNTTVMDIKQDTLRSNGAKESIWREKYLESLDAQEKESAHQQETINTLRRGLLSVSLVGDGIDKDLDLSLASLRKQLHKLDQQAELNTLLRVVEEKLLDLDNRKIQKADGMLTLLELAALSLGKLQFAQSHKRAVRRFTRKLKKPGETPQSQLVLLEDFIQLCVSIFSNLLENDKSPNVGFWQKLFSKPQPSATKSEQAKQPALDIGDSPEQALATPDLSSINSAASPTVSQSSSDTKASTNSLDTASCDRTPEPAKAYELSKSDTESMIKEFIYQLLDTIESAVAIQTVASQLRSKLLTSRDEELKNCLAQIHNLLNLAAANERNALRKYLEELSDSVSQLSKFIGQSKGHTKALSQLDKRLDKDLRLRLSSINTDIEKVTDLSDMKAALKNQLDGMLVTMDEAKKQS